MDVLGRQVWLGGIVEKSICLEIKIIVECKSAKDFHIVFTEYLDQAIYENNHFWIGNDWKDNDLKGISKILNKSQLDKYESGSIKRKLDQKMSEKFVFERSDNYVNPMDFDIQICGSFQETNIGKVKDIEASVVWRAGKALNSVVDSICKSNWSKFSSDLKFQIQLNKKYVNFSVEKQLEYILGKMGEFIILHPVLVIDSKLWKVKQNEISTLKFCRYLERNISGAVYYWFDIVNSEFLDEYIEKLTSFYKEQTDKKELTRRLS